MYRKKWRYVLQIIGVIFGVRSFCSSYFLASLVNPDDFSSGGLHILWDFAYSIKENFMFGENISWGE